MRMRMMPGVAVAALLAVVLGSAVQPPEGREERGLPAQAAARGDGYGAAVSGEFFASFTAPASGGAPVALVPRPRSAKNTRAAAPHPVPPPPSPPIPPPDGVGGKAGGFLSGNGSGTAYASLSSVGACAGESAGFADIPSGDPPPLLLDAGPVRPPSRGIRAYAGGGLFRARQSPDYFTRDNAAYSVTGDSYSLGLQYDWSVDTVVGVSVEKLSSTTRSLHPYDTRETRTDGILGHVAVDTVLFNSSLLKLRGFGGTLDQEGEGELGDAVSVNPWREEKHSSRTYGASATFSVPLLFWGYRVVMDTGVDYRHVKTDAYTHQSRGPWLPPGSWNAPVQVQAFSSSSLSFPSSFSMAKDFLSHWGLVTLRTGGGFAYETSRTAGGARALNAASASATPSPAGFLGKPSRFQSSWSGMYHVAAGLDYQSPGGWNWSVDYRRDFAIAYSRDSLRLEVGRSF